MSDRPDLVARVFQAKLSALSDLTVKHVQLSLTLLNGNIKYIYKGHSCIRASVNLEQENVINYNDRLAFAVTINKAQGQTLDKVGL